MRVSITVPRLLLGENRDVNNHPSHPPTVLYQVPSPDSSTTIHTRAHLALATHMKVSWVSDSETQSSHVSLMAL